MELANRLRLNVFMTGRSAAWGLLVVWCCIADLSAWGQFSNPEAFNLSNEVRVDEVDQGTMAHLQNAAALVAGGQYGEALGRLRQVAETDEGKVIQIRPDRYINVGDYCQMRIAALPEKALQLYRRRVDPLAEQWYRAGLGQSDGRLLRQIVAQMFCSSWGDDALLALGERALERGDPASARAYWMRLFASPPEVISGEVFQKARRLQSLNPNDAMLLEAHYVRQTAAPAGAGDGEVWFVRKTLPAGPRSDGQTERLVRFWADRGQIDQRLAYPDSPLPRAAIRARILLADIMEGSYQRAAAGLERFRKLHPGARGRLAGKEVDYAERLASLLAESKQWPLSPCGGDWTTFGGSVEREKTVDTTGVIQPNVRPPVWRHAFLLHPPASPRTDVRPLRQGRVGESAGRLLSYHPVIVGRHLFVATADSIYAWDVQTGKPAWPAGDENSDEKAAGLIYRDDDPQPEQPIASRGVARFTLSIHGTMLMARMGSTITAHPRRDDDRRRAPPAKSRLVILDISEQGQGRLLRDGITAQQPGWAFEGVPISDGRNLYVAVRRADVQSEAHVECYDLSSNPPTRLWRRFISAADTPGGDHLAERTGNLLTLHGDRLYFNTNLGTVAALSTRDGRIVWIHRYRRATGGHLSMLKETPYFYRDLNPCLYHRGTLFVAPSDTPAIIALDAATGGLLWSTGAAAGATQLLGVADGQLIAAGDRLISIDADSGRRLYRWPDGDRPEPRGNGRGLIAGGLVYWPTREQIFIFDLSASRAAGAARMPREPIRLVRRRATGGNLLVSSGRLLITTSREVMALDIEPAAANDRNPTR